LLVFTVGMIALAHVWKHFRNGVRQGRASGLGAMLFIGPMIVSGYLVQVVTQPAWLVGMEWLHLGTGTIYLTALVAHQIAVRRSRGRRAPSRGRGIPGDSRPLELSGRTGG
jgi:hypothetical protein